MSTTSHRVCTLPGGYVDAQGAMHREAELAPLSGREEELLAGLHEASSAARVTYLLSRCVRRLGSITPVTEAVARRLLIADRQYLLLQLRALSFGDRIEGTLGCPWPECGARVDIDFSITGIPVKKAEATAAAYTVTLAPEAVEEDGDGAPRRTITFRLPNGEDQEALADTLAENPALALTRLFERCIHGADGEPASGRDLAAQLSPGVRREIEQAMQAHAPYVELNMEVACPECSRAFTAPFDVQDFFFGELRTSRDLLYRQVHYLAYHYHWSEREILEMPRDKRRAYIEILAEEIEALNEAV